MLQNVTFTNSLGSLESNGDLGLILISREIQAPQVKTKYVDIEGADGSLDLTECFGKPRYKNRTIKLVFSYIEGNIPFWEKFSQIQNILHGKSFDVFFDDDDFWYYKGRVSVDKWNASKIYGSITVTITAEAYKLCRFETKRKFEICGTTTIALMNQRMDTVPTFRSSVTMTVSKGNNTLNLTPNVDVRSRSMVLSEGKNTISVTGNGELEIRYQEGSL